MDVTCLSLTATCHLVHRAQLRIALACAGIGCGRELRHACSSCTGLLMCVLPAPGLQGVEKLRVARASEAAHEHVTKHAVRTRGWPGTCSQLLVGLPHVAHDLEDHCMQPDQTGSAHDSGAVLPLCFQSTARDMLATFSDLVSAGTAACLPTQHYCCCCCVVPAGLCPHRPAPLRPLPMACRCTSGAPSWSMPGPWTGQGPLLAWLWWRTMPSPSCMRQRCAVACWS